MHQDPQYAGALFQVASQFNLLEMTSPDVTPEDGVTRYAYDRTQGPACAIAAGAATLYRNYFVPNGGSEGADERTAAGWPGRRRRGSRSAVGQAGAGPVDDEERLRAVQRRGTVGHRRLPADSR